MSKPHPQDLSVPVIAIDGYSGTGKGAVRALVAWKLGFHELDSGVLYRAVGYESRRQGILDNEGLISIAEKLKIIVDGNKIILDNRDITSEIRSDEVGKLASAASRILGVREALRDFQLDMRKSPGLVADGRDMGEIFEGSRRFFLTATPEIRAERRVRQFNRLGLPAEYEVILNEIKSRDKADMNREVCPLKPHPQALVIDTSSITADEVSEIIVKSFKSASF